MNSNPIIRSYFKTRMRGVSSPILLTVFSLFLLLVILGMMLLSMEWEWLAMRCYRLESAHIGMRAFEVCLLIQITLLVLVIPAITAGAISGERERQTLDLLLVTRMSAARIAVGKLVSSMLYSLLLLAFTAPAMALTVAYGGIDFSVALNAMGFLLVCALYVGASSLLASSLTKRTVTAVVLSYLVMIVVGILSLVESGMELWHHLDYLSKMKQAYDGMIPVGAFFNPGVALLAFLGEQLKDYVALEGLTGMRGNFDLYGEMAAGIMRRLWSMQLLIMPATSFLLVLLSTLFIKPTTKLPRRRKK